MKTPEEKAREYADNCIEKCELEITLPSKDIHEYIEDAYLDSYHSRDEEVKELREALKDGIELLELLSPFYFDNGNAQEITSNFLAKAKQLLKEEET